MVVDGGLNPRSRLNVVVVLEEVVELLEALAEIFHADLAVFIKVKAQVIVLDEHLDIRVGLPHVRHQLVLSLCQNSNQHAHKFRGIVVEEHHFVLDLMDNLDAAALDSLELADVIYVRVRQLVSLRLLNEAQSLAALKEPQV